MRFITCSKTRVAMAAVTLIALGSVFAAVAYWTTSGTGTAVASTGTLNPPTNVSGSAAGSTVSVSWTASTTSGGAVAPQGYYVVRNNGSGDAAACGTSASSLTTTTSCDDQGLTAGTYIYKVVAVYHTWTATSAPSPSVTVAGIDHFVVSAQASATAGSAFSVTVTAKDASNNTITAYTGTVHFSSSDGNAVLPSDYHFTSGDAGSHLFAAGVTLKTAGSQSVSVNDTVQTGKTGSASVSVSAASAAELVFTQQPSSGTGGTALPTQPKVAVRDTYGNTVTSDSSTVGLSITSGTPSSGGPGTLSGCSQTEASGVISFSGCKIDKIGTGYKLHATQTGLTPDDSSAFDVALGPAAQVVFAQQPASSTGGTAFPTQPKVAVEDAGGNVETGDNATTVTVAIAINAGGGTLSGTKTVTVSAGVATFAGLSIDKIGTGYTLSATSSPATTTATSGSFNVTLGAAAQLAFTQQPASSTGGTAFPTQPKVAVEDAGGNVETGDNATTVTVAIATNAGGGTLLGTKTVTVSAGVATFTGLSIDKIGTGYSLGATSSPAHGTTTSNTFNITAGSATSLVLSAATTTPTAGAADNVTITAVDAGGNTATTYTGSHNLTFGGASTAPDGTTTPTVANSSGTAVIFGTPTAITFASGVATVSGANNGVMKLYKAETANITVGDGSINNGTGLAVTVSAAARVGIILSSITQPTPAFTVTGAVGTSLTYTSSGEGNGTVTASAKVTLADQYRNAVTNSTGSAITIDLAVANQGTVSPTSLLIASGASESSAAFTETKNNGSGKTVTVTATVHGTSQVLNVTMSS